MSEEALHYPIYVTPPDKINITSKQFHDLSVFGLSSLFISFSFVIENKEEGYKVYTRLDNAYRFNQNYKRLKDIEWYEYSNIDMAMCTIPHDHKLAKTIERFFSKFIMENK
tara:strand:- start:191 stop:523 length:333 start_codon:yes stop_codon:yes gene_type:complete